MVLETNDGAQVLTAGMCAGFPAGTGDAHRFVNRTERDVMLLAIGDRTAGDEISYPDFDMQAALQIHHQSGRAALNVVRVCKCRRHAKAIRSFRAFRRRFPNSRIQATPP